MIRLPAVAGMFYPKTIEAIEEQISRFDVGDATPQPALGVVAPHAGYQYSGLVAAKVYSRIAPQGPVILIGPNHKSGMFTGAPLVAIMAEGVWEMPGGDVEVDAALASLIMEETDLPANDPKAHENEHSLETQIPLLTHYCGEVKIVPIIMARIPDSALASLAEGIYRAIKRSGASATLVASSDFSHHVTAKTAERLDLMAIERIEALDASGLLEVVRGENISMCGVQPTAVVLDVCKRLGATSAELIEYKTSGDTTGDYRSVVGYGGLIIR
ncbi:Candidate gene for the hypothesized phosphomevalonate decarboxylase; COG1355, Predicted dioxygenase [hydrothermal vent metagenome]|uniref:Candidate gene for the hypothesized phosphomevalonate decarboxylase COG1355, Predicted dioxygenase n=1 Tax=hydrothermal vent metagenome TaxID=652676 RepID=A0A3B1CMR5_9ZZZZ